MEKEVVPYEESLALAQIGFVQSCWHAYHDLTFPSKEDKHKLETVHNLTSYTESCVYQYVNPVLAPTYSQAFRWFREKYNLYCFTLRQVGINTSDIFFISSYYKGKKGNSSMNTCIPSETYEEAELACLKKLIEIVKNGK
jgi:hypothetical protein